MLSLFTICNGHQDLSFQLLLSICYRPGSIIAVSSTVENSNLNNLNILVNKYMKNIMTTAKRQQSYRIKSDRIKTDVGLSQVVT